MFKQKCVITIEGDEEKENVITMRVDWIPKLDMVNTKNNHRGVVEASLRALDSLKRDNIKTKEAKAKRENEFGESNTKSK
ncbi:MAG: hypothetical protein ABIC57_01120 [bacterium]